MSQTPLVISPRGRDAVQHPATLAAGLLPVVAFGLLGGPIGAAVGLVPAVALVAGGPLLAFIAGTIAVMGAAGTLGMSSLAAHVVLTAVLVAGVYTEYGRRLALLAVAIGAAYVGLFVLTKTTTGGLVEPTAVLLGMAAFGSYLIHRYEQLTLGLLDE